MVKGSHRVYRAAQEEAKKWKSEIKQKRAKKGQATIKCQNAVAQKKNVS